MVESNPNMEETSVWICCVTFKVMQIFILIQKDFLSELLSWRFSFLYKLINMMGITDIQEEI